MQNREAGRLVGINTERTARWAFGVGIAFTGAAGGLLAMLYSFSPSFGAPFLLRAFVVIVLGGLESFSGVAIGALILALAETFSILVTRRATSRDCLFVAGRGAGCAPGGVAGLWNKRQHWA